MLKKFIEGIKQGIGFILAIVLFLSVSVFAYGEVYHFPSHFIPGTFEGNYSVSGSLAVGNDETQARDLEVEGDEIILGDFSLEFNEGEFLVSSQDHEEIVIDDEGNLELREDLGSRGLEVNDIEMEGNSIERESKFVAEEIESTSDRDSDEYYLLLSNVEEENIKISGSFYGARGSFGYGGSGGSNYPAGIKLDLYFQVNEDGDAEGSLSTLQGARGNNMNVEFSKVDYGGEEFHALRYYKPNNFDMWNELHFRGFLKGIEADNFRLVRETSGDFGGFSSSNVGQDSKITIDTDEVVIGTDLELSGSGVLSSQSTSSDIELKDNVSSLDIDMEEFLELGGYYYNNGSLGLSAQELGKIHPSLIEKNSEGYKTLNYEKFNSYLLELIKKQEERIDFLEELYLTMHFKDSFEEVEK